MLGDAMKSIYWWSGYSIVDIQEALLYWWDIGICYGLEVLEEWLIRYRREVSNLAGSWSSRCRSLGCRVRPIFMPVIHCMRVVWDQVLELHKLWDALLVSIETVIVSVMYIVTIFGQALTV